MDQTQYLPSSARDRRSAGTNDLSLSALPIVDRGSSVSILGIDLQKLAGAAAAPHLPIGINQRLSPQELALLKKTAIAIELNQPLLVRGTELVSYLPLLRLLGDLTGWPVHYVDARSRLSLKQVPAASSPPALFAIEAIEQVTMIPAAAALRNLLGIDRAGGALDLPPCHRIVASALSPDLAATATVAAEQRTLLGSFVYTMLEQEKGGGTGLYVAMRRAILNAEAQREEPPAADDVALGRSIESLPEWEAIDGQVRRVLSAIDILCRKGRLSAIDGAIVSVSSHYPRVIGFMWRFFDGDLARTAQRALRHTIQGYFSSQNDRALVAELVSFVAPHGSIAAERIVIN